MLVIAIRHSSPSASSLRTALYQAASMARLHEPALQKFTTTTRNELHKHHSVAISHVARKLLAIIYAVCARGQAFDPTKICAQPT